MCARVCVREKKSQSLVFFFFFLNLHTFFLWKLPASIFSADLCGTDRRAEVFLVFHLHFTLFSARRNALGHFSLPRPLPMPFIFLFSTHKHTNTHTHTGSRQLRKCEKVEERYLSAERSIFALNKWISIIGYIFKSEWIWQSTIRYSLLKRYLLKYILWQPDLFGF